jgi:hypothetical protein
VNDPYRVFRGAPGKHRTLKALWPELYDCLAGTAEKEADAPARKFSCCIGSCSGLPVGKRPQAVARLSRYGPPACVNCLKLLADKPGGWPLELERNRK